MINAVNIKDLSDNAVNLQIQTKSMNQSVLILD